jgi:hypothetical protein
MIAGIGHSDLVIVLGRFTMQWEYRDEMVMFKETPEGLTSNLEFLNDRGAEGWELVSGVPLIAPNRDGVAYGTVGVLLLMKRPRPDCPNDQ